MTTTRYYQINGEFHTYEYWHDHEGYTLDATYNVTYKTTNPWGGAASESGYCDTAGSFDLFDFSFFIHGVVGWKTANELALEGYYLNADDGEEFLVEKDGVVSNAAMITDGTRSWYLIEEEIESGWMTQAEYEASGWQPYTPDESPKGYIVVDSTGAIQHSIDSDGMFIHQIQHSVDVVSFYFTSNGAAETENSELESGVDVTLYNADGTVADDDLYDGEGTLTYTQANGNMFEAADGGDLISLQSGALVMNPNADYTAISVQVEEMSPIVVPTLTLDLYYSSTKVASTFNAGGYKSGYVDPSEYQAVLDFGISLFDNGQYGKLLGVFAEGYEYALLGLLDENHNIVLSDMSNFYLSFNSNENGSWAIIRAIAAYSTASVYWRLKITKPDVLTGYYKDGNSYLYWDSRRTIKIKYSAYDIRTCVRATEYIDPRWADQPGYGDGTREIDPSKVSLQWYSAGSYEISPHFDNDVTIWNDSVVVIEYTLCKQMYLYRYETETGWTGPDYYYQGNVTKSFTGTKQDWALGLLRTADQGGGTTVAWDDSKRYELGSYDSSNEWVPYSVQSLSDMPDTTAGSLGEATLAYLIVNLNGYLGIWFVSNYTSAVSSSMKTFRLRIYDK